MDLIFHIARREQWAEALQVGAYLGPTLDSEGFIHCSRAEQLGGVLERYFQGQHDLVVFEIDRERVWAEVRDEPGGSRDHEAATGGELFPHVYGPLNLSAVRRVSELVRGQGSSFELRPIWSAGD